MTPGSLAKRGAAAPVACIVLAAGLSRRFGTADKLLATVAGEPLILAPVRAAAAAGCQPVVVVVKPRAAAIRRALDGLPVTIVENERFEEGLGTSLAAGVRALPDITDAVFVLPGDMPRMQAYVLQRLAATFDEHGGREVIVPVTPDGDRRNPVLWPRQWFERLATLDGDRGAKRLIPPPEPGICRHLAFAEDGCFADIDSPADLDR